MGTTCLWYDVHTVTLAFNLFSLYIMQMFKNNVFLLVWFVYRYM